MPKTPEEFTAALFVVIVLSALALVGVGRLVVWVAGFVRGVNHSAEGRRDYVAQSAPASPPVPPFPLEREPERERERAGTDYEPPPLPGGKLYTPEQIQTLEALAEERGRAAALGLLLGRQLVEGAERGAAMELLFGPRGRRHQRVRPLIDQAAAQVAPAAEAARIIGVGGDGHQVEL